MSVRLYPKYGQELSPLGGYVGGLARSEMWVALDTRYEDLEFWCHFFVQTFLSLGDVGQWHFPACAGVSRQTN